MNYSLKTIILLTFFILNQGVLSQSIIEIDKRFVSKGNSSFPPKNYISRKRFYSNNELIYQLNYAYNGWQIVDSSVYQKTEQNYLVTEYNPIYDDENRKIKSYDVGHEYLVKLKLNDKLSLIKDSLDLLREYLTDLSYLLDSYPKRNKNVFEFKEGLKTLLFSEYGISLNELLKDFTFKIDGNVLQDDSFVYESFTLTRNYEYERGRLKEVKIFLKDSEGNILAQYREVFEFLFNDFR